MNAIPVNEPLLDGNERRYLLECIDSGWISSEGPFVQRLEEGMARCTGRHHAVAVCNGSAALEVAEVTVTHVKAVVPRSETRPSAWTRIHKFCAQSKRSF